MKFTRRNNKSWKFATRAIHAGQEFDSVTGSIIPPIFATATYASESPGTDTGFQYARTQNPTRFAYERALASLENGKEAFAFASGLAATATVLDLLPAGSHLISVNDLYGGTYRLFERVAKPASDLEITYADLSDIKSLEASIRPNTKMIWVETPTNPLLKLVDLAAVADIAKKKNILTVCDNTFATPFIHAPIDFGFDMSLHSTTKYVSGHSDMVGGAVIVRDDAELIEKMRFLQNAVGAIPGPFDVFLAHRGLKTLGLRMERHCENAMKLAEYLSKHPKVASVIYPGLSSHKQHSLAKEQMKSFGGMVSATLKTDLAGTKKVLENTKVFILAQSLGGVESLISLPALMTHASIPADVRKQIGVEDSLIRLSVGIEDSSDQIVDLEQALSAI